MSGVGLYLLPAALLQVLCNKLRGPPLAIAVEQRQWRVKGKRLEFFLTGQQFCLEEVGTLHSICRAQSRRP